MMSILDVGLMCLVAGSTQVLFHLFVKDYYQSSCNVTIHIIARKFISLYE